MAKVQHAKELRKQFLSIPKPTRDDHQGFAIRIWRALSWLDRVETLDPLDHEGKFISLWISFNALYGQLDEQGHPWGDREAWNAFLSRIWKLDTDQCIAKAMNRRQIQILRLIGNKFLCTEYWVQQRVAQKQADRECREANVAFGTKRMYRVLPVLFDRLYVMRVQIFHGASTKGSKLNRQTLKGCVLTLQATIPAFIVVMLDRGIREDWGAICFAPRD
jgi:hypothetical protein